MMPPWEAIRQRTQEVVERWPFAARSNKMFWRGGAGKHINTDVRGVSEGGVRRGSVGWMLGA